jgi:CheY-like chemotaxis protein/anti-sigma regulatory factor (Ser/Thr protein kinase)
VRIDPTQMHQMLMNLCTNAFHAMEDQGGKLDIRLQRVELDAQQLAARPSVRPGTYIELVVGDTGSGIPDGLVDRIFDPFFTTKELGKGTGMGLSIVHGIVTRCEGFVTVDSVPGQGTTFHVFLPVAAESQPAPVAPDESLPHGSGHILFIDDEEMLVSIVKIMLERLGYVVTARTSSLEALTTFQNQPDLFDLVITDLTMPGMTGLDLSRRLLQIRPDLPIILCTGFSTLVTEEKARALGIRALAYKPLTKKDMAPLINSILHPKPAG